VFWRRCRFDGGVECFESWFRPGSRGFGSMRIGLLTRVVGFWASIFELKDVWDVGA
jgi:hypothetical protein